MFKTSDNKFGGREWEWRFVTNFSLKYQSLVFGFEQFIIKFNGLPSNNAGAINWYEVDIRFNPKSWRLFNLGMNHDYYDGPIHTFSLGFINFSWRPINKRCYICEPVGS